ncbi:hypothetical protein PR202_gb10485 [Eleusine coracana subsp. coracana]|uniref:Uncharacterized protein n=1 Tax=Eleusine coracana subsp. coracana TaxID=191504 RepID=A0AAV5EJN4_ELECO|nr:hypothetical protein PR202_gb10485 [Eleusine coracana subsp. coracana]
MGLHCVGFCPNPFPAAADVACRVHSFGLFESTCTDNSGLSFLYDAGRRAFITMPSLHAPRQLSISFGGSLYVVEQVPYPCYPQKKRSIRGLRPHEIRHLAVLQQVVFIMVAPLTPVAVFRAPWTPDSMALLSDPTPMLGGGAHPCISTEGIGTYCFDTTRGEWARAGDWRLPFYGKAEHVSEFDLCFNLSSARDLHLCVADLFSVLKGRKPTLRNI